MKTLFIMDAKDYTKDLPLVERHGVRGLIRRGNLWAMQYADGAEYKIPGGGKEPGETDLDTLRREVLEETGLTILEDSVQEIGEVLEKRRDLKDSTKRFVAHSRYFFCDALEEVSELQLTESEKARGYHLAWADLDTIIETNERQQPEQWLNRDTQFLRWLREQLKETL